MTYLNPLTTVLIRLHRKTFAVSLDIEGMLLMVRVQQDQLALRYM